MTKRRIIAAVDVPCPWCEAVVGQPCVRNSLKEGWEQGRAAHDARVRDAEAAQRMMEALLDEK